MRRILVIEDEPVIQALISASLADCEVAAVTDGRDALNSALAKQPDLILLDVGLPGMSGAEVLRRLRAEEATAAIPVVILTGMEPPEDAKPDGVLRKPFTPALLRESVAAWL